MWATLVNSKERRFVMAAVYSNGVLLHKVSLDVGTQALNDHYSYGSIFLSDT